MRIQIFIPKEFEIVYNRLFEIIEKDERFKEVLKNNQQKDKRIKNNQRSLIMRYVIAYYVRQKGDEQKLKENSQKDIAHDTSRQI
jgi:hypothetical protein